MNTNPKRPVSVWIATIGSGVAFVAALLGSVALARYLLTQTPAEQAVFLKALIKNPFYPGRIMLALISFPALIFKSNAPFTYYCTATFLLLFAISLLQNAVNRVPIPPFGSRPLWFMGLIAFALFCEFTFSRKSREYFGFTRATSPPSLK